MNFKKIDFKKILSYKKNVSIILGGTILIVAASAWLILGGNISFTSQTTTDETPDFQTSIARLGDLTISADGTGTLVAGKFVDLSFSTEGIAEQVLVRAGEKVTQGTLLAKMNNTKSLEAQVAANELTLLEAKKILNDLQSAKDVNLAQSYQDMLTAQKTYEDALWKFQRKDYARCSEEVNKKNLAALEKARDRLEQIGLRYYGSDSWIDARNVYDTALANYNYCIKFSDEEKADFQAAFDVADVNLKQARENYETLLDSAGINPDDLSLAEAKITEAQIKFDLSKENLGGSTLIAPINGTVTFLAANTGAYVDTSTFVTISDLSTSNIDVSVDETDIDKLYVGAKATIVFDALDNETYTGRVIQVNPELSSSGQYRVATAIIGLDDVSGSNLEKLPLGVNASVTIIAKESKNTLLVPTNAVRNLGNGQFGVFVVQTDGSLLLKIVDVGLSDTTRTEILSGIHVNDIVSTGLASGLK